MISAILIEPEYVCMYIHVKFCIKKRKTFFIQSFSVYTFACKYFVLFWFEPDCCCGRKHLMVLAFGSRHTSLSILPFLFKHQNIHDVLSSIKLSTTSQTSFIIIYITWDIHAHVHTNSNFRFRSLFTFLNRKKEVSHIFVLSPGEFVWNYSNFCVSWRLFGKIRVCCCCLGRKKSHCQST